MSMKSNNISDFQKLQAVVDKTKAENDALYDRWMRQSKGYTDEDQDDGEASPSPSHDQNPSYNF